MISAIPSFIIAYSVLAILSCNGSRTEILSARGSRAETERLTASFTAGVVLSWAVAVPIYVMAETPGVAIAPRPLPVAVPALAEAATPDTLAPALAVAMTLPFDETAIEPAGRALAFALPVAVPMVEVEITPIIVA